MSVSRSIPVSQRQVSEPVMQEEAQNIALLTSQKFKEDLQRVAAEAPTLTEQAVMSPTMFSNFGGSIHYDNRPKTPNSNISIQQKVELLSKKINEKLARSKSGGNTSQNRHVETVNMNIVNVMKEPESPSPQKMILNDDSELPPRASQPRQRNLQQSASPTKKILESSHDFSREDLSKPPISPINGGNKSFKQFLSKKGMDQSLSGSKKSASAESPMIPNEIYQ